MQIKQNKLAFFLILLSVIVFDSAGQQAFDTVKLHKYLDLQKKRLGFSGLVIISLNGKTIFNQCIGESSVAYGLPVSPNSVFPIASVTKSFTSSLILLAVAEGKLRIKDSISRFFPELADPQWRNITIEQLLTHRSGIPHNDGITDYWTNKMVVNYARVPAMKEIFSMQLKFKPGSQVNYSSPGYFVLASILENVYGKSYAELIEEKVCRPLGLKHTGQLDNKTIVPNLVSGYHLVSDQLFLAPYRSYSLMKGSGDLYSTGSDLISFLNSFYDPDKWPKVLQEEMFEARSIEAVRRGDLYTYGWFLKAGSPGQPKAFYHGGGSFGVSSLVARYPEEKLSVVILSNISVMPVNEIWADVEKIVLGKAFELPLLRNSISIKPELMKLISGTYLASNDMQLKITPEKDKLYCKMGSNPAFELFRESGLQFYGKKVDVDFVFESDSDGVIKMLVARRMGQIYTFRKIEP